MFFVSLAVFFFLQAALGLGAAGSALRDSRPSPDKALPAEQPRRSAARSLAASAAPTSPAGQAPSPTRFSVPAIERTWLCRKERADALISITSPVRDDIEPIERPDRALRLAMDGAEGGEIVACR